MTMPVSWRVGTRSGRPVIPMARIDDRVGFGAERGAPPSWRPAAGRGPGRLDAGGPAGKHAGAPKQGGPRIGQCFGPLVLPEDGSL